MDMMQMLAERRTYRRFLQDKQISQDVIDDILTAHTALRIQCRQFTASKIRGCQNTGSRGADFSNGELGCATA